MYNRTFFLVVLNIFTILTSSVFGQWIPNTNPGLYPPSHNPPNSFGSQPGISGPYSNPAPSYNQPGLNNNPLSNFGSNGNPPANSRKFDNPFGNPASSGNPFGNPGLLDNPPGVSHPYQNPPGNSGNLGQTPVKPGNFGNPPGNFGNFGQPPGNSGNFGSPSGNSGNFGSPPGNTGNFGSPPGNSGNFGSPPGNSGNFGSPPGNSGNLGQAPANPGSLSNPFGNFGNFGKHPSSSGNFDHPHHPLIPFHNPAGLNNGNFGNPQPPSIPFHNPDNSENFGNHPGNSGNFESQPKSLIIANNPPASQVPPSSNAPENSNKQPQSTAVATTKPKDDGSSTTVKHTKIVETIVRKVIPVFNMFSHEGNPLKDHRIVCIFNNKHFFRDGFTPGMIDPNLCTHINYEFAKLDPKTYEMIVGDPDLDLERNFFQEAMDLKKVNDKLKIILSLGGWFDSTKKYSEMADDPAKRKNFVAKAKDFIDKHGFDGLDVAWEYPNCWQGALGVYPKDKENFVALLVELRAEFKDEKILSVSVSAIKREIDGAYDVPKISEIVDFINVMTYDMHGPWENSTGHHMQFDKVDGDKDPYCNVKAAMNYWAEKGADKKKLNLGEAFYAKTFTLADPNNHGLGALAIGMGNAGQISGTAGFMLFNEICKLLNSGNWTESRHKQAGVYAYSRDQWACYDNPMIVVQKVTFVVNNGFGGVLLKDVCGDDYKGTCFKMSYPLTKMIFLKMKQLVGNHHHKLIHHATGH